MDSLLNSFMEHKEIDNFLFVFKAFHSEYLHTLHLVHTFIEAI